MRTEIFATLGPSCSQRDVLEKMIDSGMTGIRLNLSHAGLYDSRGMIGQLRAAQRSCRREISLLMDMQGPEIRTGELAAPMEITDGERVELSCASVPGAIPVSRELAEKLSAALGEGNRILLDDGRIELLVISASEGLIRTEVLRGGLLKGHKSLKCDVPIPPPPVLSDQDIQNIRNAREYGVSALMQPFVTSGKDLEYVRDVLRREGALDMEVYAKIENRQGIENLGGIIPLADMIVIARGDLGNDVPLWELPGIQKRISRECREAGKPFMVVTQMLWSMEKNPVPTRAEVSDIFNAVCDGAGAVMLTGETAVGDYPVESVRYMADTVKSAWKYLENRRKG